MKEIRSKEGLHTSRGSQEAVRYILDNLEKRATFGVKGVIDTGSNLNSKIFSSILTTVGLSATTYETKYNYIDAELLGRRNRIAHGDYLDVDEDTIEEMADLVVGLLRDVKTDIENAIIMRAYLQPTSGEF